MSETLKIILGYVSFFGYMLLLIIAGEWFQKKTGIPKEVARKLEHIAAGATWLILCAFTGPSIHTVIINFIGTAVLGFVTFSGVMGSIERENGGKSYGVLYFGISTLAVMAIAVFVNKDFYPFTGISFYCMVLGDGLAPLTTRWLKKYNFYITAHKTVIGAVTVFVFSCLSAFVFSRAFHLNLSFTFILSLGALSAVVELFSTHCTDNLTMELAVFGYLVLNYYGLASPALQTALFIAFPLVLLNGALHALTDEANLVSWVFLIAIAFFGGTSMVVTVLGMYVIALIVGVITVLILNRRGGKKKTSSRGAIQILANSSVALLLVLLSWFTMQRSFLIAAHIVVIEEFADSMASDIGRTSKKSPRDIITHRTIEKGLSGGVTLLGTLCAAAACFAASLIPFAFGVFALKHYLLSAAVAFIGVTIDSILGSRIQACYLCPVCGKTVEQNMHCGNEASLIKGYRRVTNSAVNFLSGAATAVIYLAISLFSG